MKLNSKFRIGLGAAFACLALTNARANTIGLTVDPNFPPGTTAYVLGTVDPGVPASPDADVTYINAILGLSAGGTGQVPGSGNNVDYIYRSQNSFDSTPTATTVGDDVPNGNPTTSIDLTTGYTYLVAKYAGGNGGAGGVEIWDIADILAGNTIDIPEDAFGSGNDQYQLSGWEMYNATGTENVPDGSPTVLLLGIAASGLFLVQRYLSTLPKLAKARRI